ncbi:MAG: ATP synthase archaeal subunit H [Dethiobacteria bacterium]
MTIKLVESIREAENQANITVREAQQKARQRLKDTEEQAAQILKTAVAEAEFQAKELLNRAETEARQEAAFFLEDYQKEIDQMRSGTRARLPAVVTRIMERVVNTHADS